MKALKYISFGVFILCLITCEFQLQAQRVLNFENYMAMVAQNHPVAYQADLQIEKARANLLMARGNFDPVAWHQLTQKYFDSKQYYSLINSGLKVPTWFGIELGAGYEQNQGLFLNPENNTPADGLWLAGLSVPVGRGLLIDQRRAELRKARIYTESSIAQQQSILNQLLLDAGKSYWQWFEAYHKMQVYAEAITVAEERFNATKSGWQLGDRPAIDTLEAGIQVQDRNLAYQEAQLNYANSTALLSIYLWSEGVIPMEVDSQTTPPDLENAPVIPADARYALLIDSLFEQHPDLLQVQYAIDQLEVEKNLSQEMLKPLLNLKYNALSEPVNNNPLSEYSPNNYNWGLEFSFPLFIRKERGALRLANVQLNEAKLSLSNQVASTAFKARASLNEWQTTASQTELYTNTVRDYAGLLNGERSMFNAGESSLFMVNAREMGYINAQLKLIELTAKNRQAGLKTAWAFGILAEQF
jgi:outer membrane protein TolC